MLTDLIRKRISKHFTGKAEAVFTNNIPDRDMLAEKFNRIPEIGIYLHIPFCDRICPYCPYNKEIFTLEACNHYKEALIKEISSYIPLLANKPVTSFYIGGGTPTTMIGHGLEEIIEHIYRYFNMQCRVHMESHPNHLTQGNLDAIEAMGVKYLSIGVEALQDRHLKAIERPYTVAEVKKSVERAVARNFECVNIDFMFDLPGQTEAEIEQAGREMVNMGIQQAATYPLFRFPYTRLGKINRRNGNAFKTLFRRRKLLKILEESFYGNGFERSSVWAFTKKDVAKYCSVTVPQYVGFGASGSTYLQDIFYVNTFHVAEYIRAINHGKSPIALSIDLAEDMQTAGWLYWRLYETRFRKSDFEQRFGYSIDRKYGNYIDLLSRIGYLKNGSDQVRLTDKGAYWVHAFEDFFSISYINKLWGTAKYDPWPEKVVL
jgi:oxygen-independent coproporphyrinogen-3 oxidase